MELFKHFVVAFVAALISTLVMVVGFSYAEGIGKVSIEKDKVTRLMVVENGYLKINPYFLLKDKGYETLVSATVRATLAKSNDVISGESYVLFNNEEGYAIEIMNIKSPSGRTINKPPSFFKRLKKPGVKGEILKDEEYDNAKFRTAYFFDPSQGPGRMCKSWNALVHNSEYAVMIVYMEMGNQLDGIDEFLKRADNAIDLKVK